MDRRKSDVARHSAPRSDFLPGADAGGAADRALRHERAPRLSDGAARQRTGRHHHQSARAAQARRAARSRVRVRRQVAGDSARAGSDRRPRRLRNGTRPAATNSRTISSTFRRYRATSTRADRDGTRRATSPTTRQPRCGCAYQRDIRRLPVERSSRDIPERCRQRVAPPGRSTASAPRSLSGISAGPRADSFMSTPHHFPSMQRMETTHR